MNVDTSTTIAVVIPLTVLADVTALTGMLGEDRDTLIASIVAAHVDRLAHAQCPRCADAPPDEPHDPPVCTIRKCLSEGCCQPRLRGPRERIGSRIRYARLQQSSLSTVGMAGLLGVSQPKYSKLENGQRHIHMHEITAIAKILLVDPDTLIGDDIHCVHTDEKKDM